MEAVWNLRKRYGTYGGATEAVWDRCGTAMEAVWNG